MENVERIFCFCCKNGICGHKEYIDMTEDELSTIRIMQSCPNCGDEMELCYEDIMIEETLV